MRDVPRREARERARSAAAASVGCEHLLDRRPGDALRRRAPAGRARPGARPGAGRVPARRAAVQPGRGAAGRRCAPSCKALHERVGGDDGARHPRPDRGAGARRPGGGAARRARSSRSVRPTRSGASRRDASSPGSSVRPAMNLLPADGPLRGSTACLAGTLRLGVRPEAVRLGADGHAPPRSSWSRWWARTHTCTSSLADATIVARVAADGQARPRRARQRRRRSPRRLTSFDAETGSRESSGREPSGASLRLMLAPYLVGLACLVLRPALVTLALALADYDLVTPAAVGRARQLPRALARRRLPHRARQLARLRRGRGAVAACWLRSASRCCSTAARAGAGAARTAAVLPTRRPGDRLRPALALALQPAVRADQPAAARRRRERPHGARPDAAAVAHRPDRRARRDHRDEPVHDRRELRRPAGRSAERAATSSTSSRRSRTPPGGTSSGA